MRWFCSFKSYGDLVIACNSLRNADPTVNGLLVGSHLSPLLDVIGFNGTLRTIETGENVPALFDLKKRSYISSISEGITLRRKIQASVSHRDDLLVFDMLGVRQRLLAWPIQTVAVAQGEGNIYLDYARFLSLDSDFSNSLSNNHVKPDGKVYVFPDSRLKYKDLPDSLINSIARENSGHGRETVLVKIGSPVLLPQFDSLQINWIDGFDQLAAEVSKADLIVSADSLPAHIAEYFGVPVFMFTPIISGYWVPLSGFKRGFFSGFDSLVRYQEWLTHHGAR
jgi:hypothetical protein